jgi:hypothetical protein
MGLYPSVTTVEQILDKPGLDAWKVEQGILAALTSDKLSGESLDDFAARVAVEAESVGLKARDLGSQIHMAIEAELSGGAASWPAGHEATAEAWRRWAADLRDIRSEIAVSHPLGFGGRVDCQAATESTNTPVVIDWKTMTTKPGRKVTGYDSWGRQLAAYAEALGAPEGTLLVNVVLSTTEPGRLEVVVWTGQRLQLFRQFRAIFWLWCLLKDYWPGGEFDIAPVGRILATGETAAKPGTSPMDDSSLIGIGQAGPLRRLVDGDSNLTVHFPREQWPFVAVRATANSMVKLYIEEAAP